MSVLTLLGLLLIGRTSSARTWVLVQEGHPLYHRPGHQTAPAGWSTPGFALGPEWVASTTGFGIGYGDGDDNTVLSDMQDGYLTVYVRAHFTLGPAASSFTHLELESRFDDGFVAYLNGVEIARSHVPAGPLQADDGASAHETSDGDEVVVVDPGLLVEGDNVFAVEVHNAGLGSSDLSYLPVLWGYDTPPPEALLTRGPFVQQLGRTAARIVWETNVPVFSTVVHGSTELMELSAQDDTPKTHHSIALSGLAPGAPYYYQVQSVHRPAPMGRLHTEVNRADPYRVVVMGDTRSGHGDHRAVIREVVAAEPRMTLIAGDLVADGEQEDQWDTFFEIEAPLLRDVPLYPVLGNHEGAGGPYLDVFELPADSPSPERYYAVRYATMLAIVLDQYGNDYDDQSEQFGWLEQTLADAASDPDIRHIVAVFHHGPYSSGSHGSNMTVRDQLTPLFEQYGVAAVFSGHDHHYERATVNDVRYIITGGGGAPLYGVSGDWWTEESASEYHYCTLDMHGPRLELTAWRLDGSVLDSFVLGEGLSECVEPVDCEALGDRSCPADETGEWACLYGGCIWNCFVESQLPPDGGVGPDGSVDDPDGGPPPSEPGGVASSDDSGCGCRFGPSPPVLVAGWLALGALLVLRRRRSAVQR